MFKIISFKQKIAFSYVALAVCCIFFVWEMGVVQAQIDDAYITYRYAFNLVSGNGLVYNAGERVEGYTNLLWTLLVAIGLWLDLDAPLIGHVLDVISGILLLISSFFVTQQLLPKKYIGLSVVAPYLLYSSNVFAAWTNSGLETGLFAALNIMAFTFYLRRQPGYMVCLCILAALCRPEGCLLAALLCGAYFFEYIYERYHGFDWRVIFNAAFPGLIFFTYLCAHTGFRLFYYGDFVPNTFRAKVGDIPIADGILYLYKFLVDGPVVFLLLSMAAAWYSVRYRILFIYVLLICLYIVLVGGDVFRHGRFLLPILPILISGGVFALYVALAKKSMVMVVLVMSGLLSFPLWSLYGPHLKATDFATADRKDFPYSGKRSFARDFNDFIGLEDALERIRKVKAIKPSIKSIASTGIGKWGYYMMDARVIDMVGLTDAIIARSEIKIRDSLILPGHSRTNAQYVLDSRPDIILIPKKTNVVIFPLPALLEMYGNSDLEKYYYWDDSIECYRLIES